jgi:S-formylglutathione hydrolase FrmB
VAAAAAAVVVACAAAVAAGALASPPQGPARDLDGSFTSRALGRTLRFDAFLPRGYDRGLRRYPVIYLLHGLPAGARSYHGASFVVRQLDAEPVIVIAPEGATDSDSDPEYHDWGRGRNWEPALTRELTRVVDARFRTIRSRAGRAVVGFSAGG